jgi:hypothetical protein
VVEGGIEVGTTFRFSNHPAFIGISDGIQDAFGFLQASWRRWLPVVAAIAAVTFVLYALVGSTDLGSYYYVNPDTGRLVFAPDATGKLVTLVVLGMVTALIAGIGGWVFYATAIAGLRNKPVTFSGVVVRGLVTVLSGLLVVVAFAGPVFAVVLVTLIVPPLGILLIVAAIPIGLYVAIRLAFLGMAIFDGFGPVAGLRESWRLSQRSVLRLLGWGLTAGLISLGFGILAGVVVAPAKATGLAPLAQALSAAISATGSCLTVFIMVVLYESQRARLDPTLYPYTPAPAYPGPYGPGPYAYPPGPYPYAPGPYPPGQYPYAGGPYPGVPTPPGPYPAWPANPGAGGNPYPGPVPGYPGNPTAIPGWVNPNSPPAWPAYPNVPPPWGTSPAAGNFWAPNESDDVPAPETKPTDPPASS